jgi:hypothetical protein
MSLNDKGLIVAHLADEATRAEGTDAPEARENRDQDLQAATARAGAAAPPRQTVLHRIFRRLRPVRR